MESSDSHCISLTTLSLTSVCKIQFRYCHGSRSDPLAPGLFSECQVICTTVASFFLTLTIQCWLHCSFFVLGSYLGMVARMGIFLKLQINGASNLTKTTVLLLHLCCHIPRKHWCSLLVWNDSFQVHHLENNFLMKEFYFPSHSCFLLQSA